MIAERVVTPRLSRRGLSHRRQSVAGAVLVGAVALARADAGLVGALAPELRRSLSLDDTQIGLLASLASVTGACSALPGGFLVDRRSRRAVLAAALLVWSLALGVAGLAAGFAVLAAGRLVSGATSSVARPGAVSVIGDGYGLDARTRALARLDATEAAGAAACYLAAAAAVAIGSWRLAFFGLAAAGLLLALGARHLPAARAGAGSADAAGSASASAGASGAAGVAVRSALTVLCIRTNLVALASDSVGNFFYAGATSFGVLMVTERYGLSTATVDAVAPAFGVALIAGILLGGRLGDHLAGSTRGARRLVVAAAGNAAAAAAMLPALLGTSILASAALLALAAGLLGVGRPCLDAVRVDVIPPTWRGRAEAARGLLTLASSAAGPLVFAALASSLGGRAGHGAGLDHAFLIMLVPLAGAGLILLTALRTYERDAGAAAGRLTSAG